VTAENASRYLGTAQIVSVLNVLEHLIRPADLTNAVSAGLQRGAPVVVEVPRHPPLSSFASLLFPQLACRHLVAPEHLRIFTERSMEVLLESAGLRAVRVWIFGQDFQELVSSAALASGIAESGFFQTVCDLTPGLQQAIDDADFSDVLFVVARNQ
jgi:hypothetical protein